ncbi:MAG TPA: hypothetical protein PLN21_16780 [Gemmatales bacterium]|nr:hypothetical protein [Gemmatales bacterium]
MVIKNRKHSHFPCLEALEDRFLPSATSVLPLSNDVGQACVTVTDARSNEDAKVLDHDDKVISMPATNAVSHAEQGKVADAAFGTEGLSQVLAYKPMFAVIIYQPSAMQFHETIYFTLVPYKPAVSSAKAKAANMFSPDSDDVSSVVRNVVSTNVGNNLPVAVRPKAANIDSLAKDLVDVVVPASTNRTMEVAPSFNPSLTTPATGSGLIALPTASSTSVKTLEGQGIAQRLDRPSGDSQDALLPGESSGVVTDSSTGTPASAESRLTEKLGLHIDESSLILDEIEQVIQTLVEPFAANLESYEPSVLWVFLSTWVAAAGITYEYLRRKAQANQLNTETWKEWRLLPQQLET